MLNPSGTTTESTSKRVLWIVGKLSKCRKGGWFGIAECTVGEKSYWIWSERWFPCNSQVLIAYSTDLFMVVDIPETIEKNNFDSIWLSENQDSLESVSLSVIAT